MGPSWFWAQNFARDYVYFSMVFTSDFWSIFHKKSREEALFMAYKGISYLKSKLSQKQSRIGLRYKFYEMKNAERYLTGQNLPNELRALSHCLGWCGNAVDNVADRLVFRKFDDDIFDLNTIFDMNNKDILTDGAMLGALITSCDFVYISKNETGYPRLQVIDGYDATGIIDPITNMLTEGYAVLERDQANRNTVLVEAYFTCEETIVFDKINNRVYREPNIAPYALLVPIINKPDARRPFGHSRISRACMNIQQSAVRTIARSEVSAEFYSFPQKYVLGTSQDAERLNKFRATMSTLLEITKDDDGDKPVVGQFQQQSMSPYLDQVKMFAGLFSGETGLTLDDLGFPTDNPSSVEAIKACHEKLRLSARKAQRDFATGFKNVGYLACCVRDNYPYKRDAFCKIDVLYEPLFEPDMSSLSLIGDGAIKINQAIPGYFDKQTLRSLTGIEPSEEANDQTTLAEDLEDNESKEDNEGTSQTTENNNSLEVTN